MHQSLANHRSKSKYWLKSKLVSRRNHRNYTKKRIASRDTISDVLGKCTDSVSGLVIANIEISISGSAKKVLSNIIGDFDDPTTMYGDLELVGTHSLYVTKEIAFVKENGVNVTVDVVMVKK